MSESKQPTNASRSAVSPSWVVPAARADLDRVFRRKHGDPAQTGPGPALRHRLGYYTPDDHYEAIVDQAITPGVRWLDVGCGRELFPHHPRLAEELSQRASCVAGVDPSPNVLENPHLSLRVQDTLETWYPAARAAGTLPAPFDVVTLRMVAEHVTDPPALTLALAGLTQVDGCVIVYTVAKYAPLALAAAWVPHRWHHAVKARVWDTEERDTFPVVYRMNTRKALCRAFQPAGFREVAFTKLDDCRTLFRFPRLNRVELAVWQLCQRWDLHYPEQCLLGIYQRVGVADPGPSH